MSGSGNPRSDIPCSWASTTRGQLDLDNFVTNTYTLAGVHDGYDEMRAGKNILGVMKYS